MVDAISGNICRCTGYEPIINAILVRRSRAARARKSRLRSRPWSIVKAFFADERAEGFTTSASSERASDALGHVTGRTQFYADRNFPGCCI